MVEFLKWLYDDKSELRLFFSNSQKISYDNDFYILHHSNGYYTYNKLISSIVFYYFKFFWIHLNCNNKKLLIITFL